MYKESFFNFTDDEVYWDEKKKRFIYLTGATVQDIQNYKGRYFKGQRPDLYGTDVTDF